MQVSVRVTTQPLRTWPWVIVILIIVLIAARWAPGAALPLGLGGWLGSYLSIHQPAAQATHARHP
jgi:hypothetical protein